MISKEVVVAYFKALNRHSPGDSEENKKKSVRIAGLPAETGSQDLTNTNQEC
jgi:hypothetical protein